MDGFFEGEGELQTTLKWFALAGVGFYLWRVMKRNGGTLAGNSRGYKVSLDGVGLVDALVPFIPGTTPEMKILVGMRAKRIVKAMQKSGRLG